MPIAEVLSDYEEVPMSAHKDIWVRLPLAMSLSSLLRTTPESYYATLAPSKEARLRRDNTRSRSKTWGAAVNRALDNERYYASLRFEKISFARVQSDTSDRYYWFPEG